MKNSEIHNGLDKREIRDFLSLALVKAYDEEFANKREEIPYHHNPQHCFRWAIDDAEVQIKHLQKHVEILKIKEAIIRLIHINGWEVFDMSDEITKDLPYKLKMNFIGTEAEHEELKNKIEADGN